MNRQSLLKPKLPIDIQRRTTGLLLIIILFIILFLPWIAFTVGKGQVTAINPRERVQPITAPISAFIEKWMVKEGDRVKTGEVLVQLVDNDANILERYTRERNAAQSALEAAELMLKTSKLNLDRQRSLFEQGLTARKDYEKAKIDYSKLEMEYQKALATLTKAETQLSRQASQKVVAPQDGTIIRILPGEMGQLIKAGSPIAVFSPDVTMPAVELWVDGKDASMVVPGQRAEIQFEGWPAIQIPGWPSLSINTFKAKVHLVDQASSYGGKFRVLLVPSATSKWPSQDILRLGNHARGYIRLSESFILKEIWRQLNDFPAYNQPIQDELNKMFYSEKADGSKDEDKEAK